MTRYGIRREVNVYYLSVKGSVKLGVNFDPLHVRFYGRVLGDGGSNGAIYGSNKSKMAAAAILEKIQMAISPQRLTIYLYSAHRAVIFAIAQLSCFLSRGYSLLLTNIFTVVNTFGILLKRIYADQNGTLH